WQAVAEQVLQQEFAEAAAGFRRAQDLLEPGQVVRPLQHLGGCGVELSEPFDDLRGALASGLLGKEQPAVETLEPPVDLEVDLAQPALEPLLDAPESVVEDAAAVAGGPDNRADDGCGGNKPDDDRDHEPTDSRGAVGRQRKGAAGAAPFELRGPAGCVVRAGSGFGGCP